MGILTAFVLYYVTRTLIPVLKSSIKNFNHPALNKATFLKSKNLSRDQDVDLPYFVTKVYFGPDFETKHSVPQQSGIKPDLLSTTILEEESSADDF